MSRESNDPIPHRKAGEYVLRPKPKAEQDRDRPAPKPEATPPPSEKKGKVK